VPYKFISFTQLVYVVRVKPKKMLKSVLAQFYAERFPQDKVMLKHNIPTALPVPNVFWRGQKFMNFWEIFMFIVICINTLTNQIFNLKTELTFKTFIFIHILTF